MTQRQSNILAFVFGALIGVLFLNMANACPGDQLQAAIHDEDWVITNDVIAEYVCPKHGVVDSERRINLLGGVGLVVVDPDTNGSIYICPKCLAELARKHEMKRVPK